MQNPIGYARHSLWRGLGALLIGGAAFSASAQTSGVLSQGCAVHWQAASVLSSNNSLDGFTQTVSPASEPGWMQVQHWNWNNRVNWRVPVATDYTIRNATLTLTMSAPGGAWIYTANQALVDWITQRPVFTAPKVYTWSAPAAAPIDNGDGTWTFNLGDLAAGTGVIFVFDAPLDPALGIVGPYYASADLRGTYDNGQPAACGAVQSVPVNNPWALLGLGALAALAAAWQLGGRGRSA